MKMQDIVDRVIAYENGELGDDDTVELFQQLLDDGSVWQLQGSYGRTATDLLKAGMIIDHRVLH